MWAHLYGLTGGFRWSRAEIRRRLGVGRAAAESGLQRVTTAVAEHLATHPPSARSRGQQVTRTGDWEDAAAVTLGRAVVERHPHREEIAYAVYDYCAVVGAGGGSARTRRRLPGGHSRKRSLKTGRYVPTARTALRRALIDSGFHGDTSGHPTDGMAFPLWEAVEVETSDLDETLWRLRSLGLVGDRQRVAKMLAEGHSHIVRGYPDPERVNEFLYLEAAILGQHANIGATAVLEVLERNLGPSDPRRVHVAQVREYILERHHYWRAAQLSSQRVWERLRDPRIQWSRSEDHRLAVLRALERTASLAAKVASVFPRRGAADLPELARRVDRAVDRVRDPARTHEWRLIAQRRALQARWGTKNRDRLLGLPARWEDNELAALEQIDATAERLGGSATHMSWNNQKLNVLLSADRPQDFLQAVTSFLPSLTSEGEIRPAQVQAARSTVELARRRRSHGWRAVRADLAELATQLPDDTDDTLRNPCAIPRELVVNGIAIG